MFGKSAGDADWRRDRTGALNTGSMNSSTRRVTDTRGPFTSAVRPRSDTLERFGMRFHAGVSPMRDWLRLERSSIHPIASSRKEREKSRHSTAPRTGGYAWYSLRFPPAPVFAQLEVLDTSTSRKSCSGRIVAQCFRVSLDSSSCGLASKARDSFETSHTEAKCS